MSTIPSLVELCFQSVAEHLEYNSDAIKILPVDVTEKLISFMVDRLHPRHLVMTQTRAIKIRLIKQDMTCTFRFMLHGTVAQAIQQVYDKTEDSSGLGVQNYGLFQPFGSFRRARWLQEDKTLSYYDLDPTDALDFKIKETKIKIKFLGPWEKVVHPLHLSTVGNTVKTFIIDESKTVSDIAKDIARKLGLPNSDEFSLKRLQEEDDVGIWLVPDMTLPEQGVDPLYVTFLLKRQFYFSDGKVSTNVDSDTLHYIFCQCLDAIVSMTHPCSLDEALLFAALQCQITFGDYNPSHTALNTFRLREYLPLEYIHHKNVEPEIMVVYQKLQGMTEDKAKQGYIQLTKSLKSYLYTFFRVAKFVNNKNQTQNCLLGISADTVLIVDAETRETVERHLFTQIKKWQVLHSFFSLYLPEGKEEYLTVEAEIISQVLFTHIHHALRDMPSLQKRFEGNYDSVSRSYSRRKVVSGVDFMNTDGEGAMNIRRCPLYVEPKKIYINVLFGMQGKDHTHPKYEEIQKLNKFVRIIRLLSELSHKMIRTISKSGSAQDSEREIQVKFSDKKVKSFMVCEKKTVRELSNDIGRKLGIKNTDEFSLQLPETAMSHSYSSPSSPPSSRNSSYSRTNSLQTSRALSPPRGRAVSPPPNLRSSGSFSFPLDDELGASDGALWLNPNQTLTEQDVPPDTVLLYKKKFYYNDASDDCHNDPVYFNLLFCQSRDAIISNMYTCSKDEAIQLAATLFQINFGDHNPNIHKPGFLKPQDLRFFLPPEALELWNITFQKVEKLIYKEHRNLRGIKEVYAKFRYVQLCRTLKTFGAIFFHVKPTKERSHPLLPYQSLLIGFSRKSILILTNKSRKFLLEIPLSHLRRYAYSKGAATFTLDFGDYEEGCFTFATTEGDAMTQYLSDYIDFIQTKLVGSQALLATDNT